LELCREHNIADATAYLLERTGKVSSAMELLLQTLEEKLLNTKEVILNMTSIKTVNNRKRFLGSKKREAEIIAKENALKEKEVTSLKHIVTVALDLCERNTFQLQQQPETDENGSQLWFNVLDILMHAKGFLGLSDEFPEHALAISNVLSELLQLTMQRMVSNVPLQYLLDKIAMYESSVSFPSGTSIAPTELGCNLSELREMIVCLLKTYRLELDVCRHASDVMHTDAQSMSLEKYNLMVHGTKVKKFMGVALGASINGGKKESIPPLIDKMTIRTKPVVRITTSGEAFFTSDHKEIDTPEINFQNALSRLEMQRTKRRKDTDRGYLRYNSPSVSKMILSEKHFMNLSSRQESFGETFQQKYSIGGLSIAQNFGSFG